MILAKQPGDLRETSTNGDVRCPTRITETPRDCPANVTGARHSVNVRVRVIYEGPRAGAEGVADELRGAGFTVENGAPPEHPDILVDEVLAVFWVSIKGELDPRFLPRVRALVGRLIGRYPGARIEVDEPPDS